MFISKPGTGNQQTVEELLCGSLPLYKHFFETLSLAFVALRCSDIIHINEHTVALITKRDEQPVIVSYPIIFLFLVGLISLLMFVVENLVAVVENLVVIVLIGP